MVLVKMKEVAEAYLWKKVTHAVVTFKSDGNVQGVLAFLRFKDGKIFRQETGASNLPKN